MLPKQFDSFGLNADRAPQLKAIVMLLHSHYRLACIALVMCLSWTTQSQTRNLTNWIGKYPLVVASKPRRGLYTSPELRSRLIRLLGRKYYRRLVYDYYVMSKIESTDGYLVAQMCEQHACPSSASFMAVNLTKGDIHVGFWLSGSVEWFHTTGMARDLPPNVRQKAWWTNVPLAPDKVREVTRGAT
jgi:hypothetical protein